MIIARTDLRGVVTWTSEDAARLGIIPGARLGNQPALGNHAGSALMREFEQAVTSGKHHAFTHDLGIVKFETEVIPSPRGALIVVWCPDRDCEQLTREILAAQAVWRAAPSAPRRSPPA
jgi:hypothetical protein